jgi:hypothetical protein
MTGKILPARSLSVLGIARDGPAMYGKQKSAQPECTQSFVF